MNRFLWRQHLAGAQDPPTGSGPTEEANSASPTGRCRRWPRPAWLTPSVGVCVFALAALLIGRSSPAQEAVLDSPGYSDSVDGAGSRPGLFELLTGVVPPVGSAFPPLYIDYRVRRFKDSRTTYEFGDRDPAGPSPLSRLEFPINSTWNGLEVGLGGEFWAVRAEWLTPLTDKIDGRLEDRDWLWQFAGLPQSPVFSNLGVAEERWVEGQMVDVALEIELFESVLCLPISLWPVGGFRWQKFDIMAFDLTELKRFDSPLGFNWPLEPPIFEGDAIRFRQEYYHYYVGGQLRTDLDLGELLPQVRLTFQGDWAHVQAFNSDHHLLRQGTFITQQNTHGNAWHAGLTAEIFFSDHFTVGIEGDYTAIRTSGSHHFSNQPLGIDATWQRGVRVRSDQMAITVFVRLRR